jgi:hypothetical protein
MLEVKPVTSAEVVGVPQVVVFVHVFFAQPTVQLFQETRERLLRLEEECEMGLDEQGWKECAGQEGYYR